MEMESLNNDIYHSIGSDKCQLIKLPPAYIFSGNCVSNQSLEREMCSGKCNTYQTSYIVVEHLGVKMGNKLCKCCGASATHEETVTMICNNALVSAQYVRIDSCKCNVCDPLNNADEGFSNDLKNSRTTFDLLTNSKTETFVTAR